MTSQDHKMGVEILDTEKQNAAHEEYSAGVLDKKGNGDYSGAPTLWLMYWLTYLDRNAITLARLNGFEEDLNLQGSQYNTSVSILFVGYVLGQIPSNMIITRVRPSWYMGGFMMAWAVVSSITAVAQNYTGALLTRFFLGIVEAPYCPGALILYSGNVLASAFAGLIAAGVFEGMDGLAGIKGWRWLFILQGARQLAHDRVLRDTVGQKGDGNPWSGLREAIVDPEVWVFIVLQHLHLATNGLKNFFLTIVNTLGFNTTVSLVLTCPPFLIAGALSILWAKSSGHFNESTWHITISKIVATFGFALACATMNVGARYFATCVFTIGSSVADTTRVIEFSWV
ncbi:major facilitator superfamily transporter [Fusarium agapanthi]|uniref:Major facilitator superfamily transporter n=1 Tax=Fusarium agapanthi TaxID=1803897 RepID=A0A9P5BEZ5_9HYPO|nr:major facilitator superfamily transporter [Fusarium agapanthi]